MIGKARHFLGLPCNAPPRCDGAVIAHGLVLTFSNRVLGVRNCSNLAVKFIGRVSVSPIGRDLSLGSYSILGMEVWGAQPQHVAMAHATGYKIAGWKTR